MDKACAHVPGLGRIGLKTAGLLVEAAALGGARRRPDVRALA